VKISLVQTLDKNLGQTLPVDSLKVYPKIPVMNMTVSKMLGFAEEVRKDGQRLPLVCFKTPAGPEVVLGELYLRILKLASLEQAVITYIDDIPLEILHLIILAYLESGFMSLAEQVVLLHYLGKAMKVSHAQLALRFKLSRTVVTNRIRLFSLPYEVMSGLVNGEVSEGHVRSLLSLKRDDLIINAYEIIKKDSLSVRDAEELVRRLLGRGKRFKQTTTKLNVEYDMIAKQVGEMLGAKAYIQPLLRGGRMIVTFKSKEDLKQILEKIHVIL
jgi:ParB family chromosome partitioning protein